MPNNQNSTEARATDVCVNQAFVIYFYAIFPLSNCNVLLNFFFFMFLAHFSTKELMRHPECAALQDQEPLCYTMC